jgi:hypothetical protein
LDEIRVAEQKVQAKIATGLTKLDSIADLLASDRVQYVD